MANQKVFYYSLSIKSSIPMGASGYLSPRVVYFSTQRKLDLWRKKNPDLEKNAVFGMHEIDIKTCKGLIKLSKKKPKCGECGK